MRAFNAIASLGACVVVGVLLYVGSRAGTEAVSNDLHAYEASAMKSLEQGELNDAAAFVAQAMSIDPDHPPALNMLAFIAMHNGDFDVATDALNRSIAARPDAETYRLLAILQAKKGAHEDSITTVQTYLGDRMHDPQVRIIMAVNLYRMGQEDLALTLFNWNPALTAEERRVMIESF